MIAIYINEGESVSLWGSRAAVGVCEGESAAQVREVHGPLGYGLAAGYHAWWEWRLWEVHVPPLGSKTTMYRPRIGLICFICLSVG